MKKANDKSDEVQQDNRQTLKGVEQKDHTLEGRLDKLVDSMNQIRYLSIGILSIFAISFIFSQNSRISELEDQITETSQKVESLQLVFDKNFRGLIQEINEGFAQLGSPSFDRTTSAIFSSDFPESLGIFEEVHDFRNFFLGFVTAGNVLEQDLFVLAGKHLRFALPEVKGSFAGHSELSDKKEIKQSDDQQKGKQAEEQIRPNCARRRFLEAISQVISQFLVIRFGHPSFHHETKGLVVIA